MPIQLIFKKYQFATKGIKTHTKSKVGFQPNLPATIVNTIHALNHGKATLINVHLTNREALTVLYSVIKHAGSG